ncbi:uncharacterized protein [Clytia hemisphaerica]
MARQKVVKSKQEKSKEIVTKPIKPDKQQANCNENSILDPELANWIQKCSLSSKEIASLKEQLILTKLSDENLCTHVKDFVSNAYWNSDAEVDCYDVVFKLLRRAIDELDKSADIGSLIKLTTLLFESITALLKKKEIGFLLTEERWERGVKILFHINKYFYKKNLLQPLISSNDCIKSLLKYHKDILMKPSLKEETSKLIFMMYQMSYSIFTKEIQKIANTKDCEVTHIFNLRTQCFIMLSFINSQKMKLAESIKDFTNRWTKILCSGTFKFDSSTIYYNLSVIFTFVGFLKDDKEFNLSVNLHKVIELGVRICCGEMTKFNLFGKYLQPCVEKSHNLLSKKDLKNIHFLVNLSELNCHINMDEKEGKCTCNEKLFDNFVKGLETFISSNPDIKDMLKYLTWLKSQYQMLRNVKCSKLLELLMEITTKVLSFGNSTDQLENLSVEEVKASLQFVYFQSINILQAVDANLSNYKDTILYKTTDSFIDFENQLKSFINSHPPDIQEAKWFAAASYKIASKLYQENEYQLALGVFPLACACNQSLFLEEGSSNFLKHVKEICVMSSTMYASASQLKCYEEGFDHLYQNFAYLSGLEECKEHLGCEQFKGYIQSLIDQLWKLKSRAGLDDGGFLFERLENEGLKDQDLLLFVIDVEASCIKKLSEKDCKFSKLYNALIDKQKTIFEENGDILDYSVSMIKLSTQTDIDRNERFHQAQEAASILEEMLNEMEDEDVESSKIRDVLAMAYYQQACILYEERVQGGIENVDESLSTVADQCFENKEEEKEDDGALDQYKVQDYLDSDFSSMLNSALEMWLVCFELAKENPIEDCSSYFYNMNHTAQCLYEASVLFSLLFQGFECIRAAYMSSFLYHTQNKTTVDKRNSSLLLLVMQLLQMDCVPEGEYILNYTLKQDENEGAKEGVEHIDLAKAACYIKSGQVTESLNILHRILLNKNMDRNTRNTLLMKSDVYALLSSLKLLSHDHHDDIKFEEHHFPLSSPFPPAVDCVKYLRSLYESCLIIKKGDMVTNWLILDKLLTCLTHHAELLKQQGSIMESKGYLKEALLLAKKYNLPLRVLDILGQITAIDIILEDTSSFQNNFELLTTILSASVGQCFDGSRIYLPDFLTHVSECSCNYCTNFYLQDFHIRLYLQYIESRKSFYRSGEELFLNDYKDAMDSLTSNANIRFQTNLKTVKLLLGYEVDTPQPANKRKGRKGKKVKEDANSDENNKFSKYLAEAKILGEHNVKGSIDMISNIELLIAKLETDSSLNKTSHDFQRLIAQLYYLRSLLHVGKTSDTHKSVPDERPIEPDIPKTITRKTRGRTTVNTKRKTTRRKIKEEPPEEQVPIEENELTEKIEKLRLSDDKVTCPISANVNESFLEDLKKVLSSLNPYTDTLIIKSIYELVTFMMSTNNPSLATTTQFLASSRTLHQQILNAIGKKLRKRSDSYQTISSTLEECLLSTSCLIEKYSKPSFIFGDENIQMLVDDGIPKGWTICCISMTEVNGQQSLMLSRMQPNTNSAFIKINVGNDDSTSSRKRGVVCELASAFDQGIVEKFQEILEDSKNSMSIKDKKSWWAERQRLDSQMKSLVERIENDWLQGWKGFLLGQHDDESAEILVQDRTEKICKKVYDEYDVDLNQNLVKILVDSYEDCNETQQLECCKQLCNNQQLASNVFQIFLEFMKSPSKSK